MDGRMRRRRCELEALEQMVLAALMGAALGGLLLGPEKSSMRDSNSRNDDRNRGIASMQSNARMNETQNESAAAAWFAIGIVAALACASAISAAAALTIIELGKPAPLPVSRSGGSVFAASAAETRDLADRLTRPPMAGECVVVAWKGDETYCVREGFRDRPRVPEHGTSIGVRTEMASE